jgi:hypothetical protein
MDPPGYRREDRRTEEKDQYGFEQLHGPTFLWNQA